jgi:hypothetical protein
MIIRFFLLAAMEVAFFGEITAESAGLAENSTSSLA